jgi:hypothetical protein
MCLLCVSSIGEGIGDARWHRRSKNAFTYCYRTQPKELAKWGVLFVNQWKCTCVIFFGHARKQKKCGGCNIWLYIYSLLDSLPSAASLQCCCMRALHGLSDVLCGSSSCSWAWMAWDIYVIGEISTWTLAYGIRMPVVRWFCGSNSATQYWDQSVNRIGSSNNQNDNWEQIWLDEFFSQDVAAALLHSKACWYYWVLFSFKNFTNYSSHQSPNTN